MSSRRFLLDTDIVSYYLRGGHPRLNLRLRFTLQNHLYVSAITAAELLRGVRVFKIGDPRRLDVEAYLASAVVLPWELSAAEAYADVRHQLGTAGKPIGIMDMMIAAHALAADLTLVTNNTRHFERLTPLRLENWTEG
jgi:tRNA(fMet)-specific endonuclease VapC